MHRIIMTVIKESLKFKNSLALGSYSVVPWWISLSFFKFSWMLSDSSTFWITVGGMTVLVMSRTRFICSFLEIELNASAMRGVG